MNYKYTVKQNKQLQTKKKNKQNQINERIWVMLPKRVGTNGRPMRGTAQM